MPQDIHGLMISTSSAKAAVEFDRAVLAYLKFRVDAPELLSSVLNTDPEFGLAHCLKGYFAMLTYNQAKLPMAVEAARIARVCSARATTREKAHVEALDAWINGDLDRMLAIWEAILADHPTDILALMLGHLNNFLLGRPRDMAASIERVLPKWGYNLPGYGTVLSCRSFALEECGEYATAEPVGRQAVEIDPADFWGTHAVAHIMEMQGRHDEGIFWLQTLEPHWKSGSNLVHH